jgi:hypothetical protein
MLMEGARASCKVQVLTVFVFILSPAIHFTDFCLSLIEKREDAYLSALIWSPLGNYRGAVRSDYRKAHPASVVKSLCLS